MTLDLPPPGEEPTEAWIAAYKALPLPDRLDVAVKLAQRLRDEAAKAFPAAAATVPRSYAYGANVQVRLDQGNDVAAQLTSIALQLAPERTLDLMDDALASDSLSAKDAKGVLQRFTTKGAST